MVRLLWVSDFVGIDGMWAGRPQVRAPAGAGWQGVGGRGRVGSREKWLYFSYTPRLVSLTPWLLSTPLMRVVVLARSRFRVAKSRWRCRCSSAATEGTCTTRHP